MPVCCVSCALQSMRCLKQTRSPAAAVREAARPISVLSKLCGSANGAILKSQLHLLVDLNIKFKHGREAAVYVRTTFYSQAKSILSVYTSRLLGLLEDA